MNLQICYLKIDVSCEASVHFHHISQNFVNATPATEFAPCRHLEQPWDCDSQKSTQHDTSKVLRLPRKMMMDTSTVLRLLRKLQRIFWKRRESIALATKTISTRHKTRLNVTKCNTCHAKRSNATCATSKSDPFCSTYHRHGHTGSARMVADGCGRLRTVANGCGRLRTVADGCERLRTVANGCGRLGNVERTHPQPPDPQSETGTLAATTHSGKTAEGCLNIFEYQDWPCQWRQWVSKIGHERHGQSLRYCCWSPGAASVTCVIHTAGPGCSWNRLRIWEPNNVETNRLDLFIISGSMGRMEWTG